MSVTLSNEWFRVSRDQCRRYANAFLDPLYLLKSESIEEEEEGQGFHKYSIVGTTKNVYTISINLLSRKIWCNCPDQKSHCQKKGVSCKHIAFVISKIGKISDINLYKAGCKEPLSEEYIKTIWENATKTSIDKRLVEKYDALTLGTTSTSVSGTSLSKTESVTESVDELLNGETDCPICFSELKNDGGNLSECLSCKQCKKYVHVECFDRWCGFNAKKCCVYCRYSFVEDSRLRRKKKTPNNNNSEYVNLL